MRSELHRTRQPKDRLARRIALAAVAAAWGVALGAAWGPEPFSPGSALAQEASTPPVAQRSEDQDAAMKELSEALRQILGGATPDAIAAEDASEPAGETDGEIAGEIAEETSEETVARAEATVEEATIDGATRASAPAVETIATSGIATGGEAVASAAASTARVPATAVAPSKPIRVQGGEHADHSRLVIGRLPVDDWDIASTKNGLEIRIPQRGLTFDVDRIVKRHVAHRIVTADTIDTPDGTILRFGYNCDCRADVSTLRGGQLKIDVRDGAPTAIAEAASAPAQPAASAPSADPTTTEQQASDETERLASAQTTSTTQEAEPLDLGPLETASTLQDDVEAARNALLASLQSGQESGVVNLFDPAPEAPAAAASEDAAIETPATASSAATDRATTALAPSTDADIAASGADAAAPPAPSALAPDQASAVTEAVSVTETPAADQPTTSDLPASPEEEAFGPAQAEFAERLEAALAALNESPDPISLANADFIGATLDSHCLADVDLDPRNWRDRRSFFDGLQRKRAWIYDDLNRADPVAVASLSKYYLAHGLGEEAANMPVVHRVDTEETRFAQHLADVLMKRPPAEGSPFLEREPCEGLHGVWQAAALSDIDPKAAVAAYLVSEDAIIGLVSPHRRMFGARIARAAAHIGQLETARSLLETLSRNSDAPTLDMLWAQAEIELEDGSVRRGRRALKKIMESRTEEAPLAAIRLAATYAPGQSLTDAQDVADLSGALQDFALQYRRTDVGAQAIAAEASLLARYGDLSAAVELLDRSFARWPELTEKLRARKTDLIQNEIAAAVDDPTPERMSAAVRAAAMLDATGAGDTLRIALSETLLSAGVPSLAPLVLTEAVAARSPTAAQLLAEANAAGALTPAADGVSPDEATERLRSTPDPEMQYDRPISSGRAMVQTLETELELMREIARGAARPSPTSNVEQ